MQEKITLNVNFVDKNAFSVFKKELNSWVDAWVAKREQTAKTQELKQQLSAIDNDIRASFLGHQITDDMYAGTLTKYELFDFIHNSCNDKVKYSASLAEVKREIDFYVREEKFKAIGKLVARILRKSPRHGTHHIYNLDKLTSYLTKQHVGAIIQPKPQVQPQASNVATQLGKKVTELIEDGRMYVTDLTNVMGLCGFVVPTIVSDELYRMSNDGEFKRIGKRIKYMVQNGTVNANLLELKLKAFA